MGDIMLRVDNVSKQYKLGQIGGTTLRDELQRWAAKRRGQEDPTRRIGAKDYTPGETFLALDGVSFDVARGERVGIIGHNGAGKSTLLKLISRVTAPTSGTIGLNGRVASMLEVGTGFHGELTGRENIYMNGAILGMTRREIDAKMEDIIEFSECRQFIDTPVKRYSSGMYVKLAFSVAAHLDSEIMIMDEVLAVGDMAFQKKCLEKMGIVSSTDGRTILYVSHNMNTIRQLCNRAVVLDHGKVILDGDVEGAIALYMEEGDAGIGGRVDLTDAARSSSLKEGLKFTAAVMISGLPMTVGDKLRFRIAMHKEDGSINTVILRALLRSSERPIGMSVSEDIACKDMGSLSGIVEIDTSTLAPGEYTVHMECYEPNRMYDSVDVFRFVVLNDTSKTRNADWYRPWGSILFPPLTYAMD